MKKIILIFSTLTILLTSCKKDEVEDTIVGSWSPYKTYLNGKEQLISDCDKKDILTFGANNSLTSIYYDIDKNDECEELGKATGTWKNLGNNVYEFSAEGESSQSTIFFEKNTFYFIDKDTYTKTDDKGNDIEVTDTYKEVYIRK